MTKGPCATILIIIIIKTLLLKLKAIQNDVMKLPRLLMTQYAQCEVPKSNGYAEEKVHIIILKSTIYHTHYYICIIQAFSNHIHT